MLRKHQKAQSYSHTHLIPFGPPEVTNGSECGISWLTLSLSNITENDELGNTPNDGVD